MMWTSGNPKTIDEVIINFIKDNYSNINITSKLIKEIKLTWKTYKLNGESFEKAVADAIIMYEGAQ